jgi:hypothetical protein
MLLCTLKFRTVPYPSGFPNKFLYICISSYFLPPTCILRLAFPFLSYCILSIYLVNISLQDTRPSEKVHLVKLVNSEGSFGRSYHFHLQGQDISAAQLFFLECLTLNLVEMRFSETSVPIYQCTWRDIPEDLNLQQHLYEALKSLRIPIVTFPYLELCTVLSVLL